MVYEETPDANLDYKTIIYGMLPSNPQAVLDFFNVRVIFQKWLPIDNKENFNDD